MKRFLAILMTIAIFGAIAAAGCGGGETEAPADKPAEKTGTE